MAVKPILFSGEMIRAILCGDKTVTRRVIRPQPKMRLCHAFAGYGAGNWMYPSKSAWKYWGEDYKHPDNLTEADLKAHWNPPCRTDDILYARETWCRWYMPHGEWLYCYKATDPNGNKRPTGPEYDDSFEAIRWRPSIHMPKEAARIWLKVTGVNVERLQDITAEECRKEGIFDDYETLGKDYHDMLMEKAYPETFSKIWDSTIKKSDLDLYGWQANPWVWVVEFERLEKQVGRAELMCSIGRGE